MGGLIKLFFVIVNTLISSASFSLAQENAVVIRECDKDEPATELYPGRHTASTLIRSYNFAAGRYRNSENCQVQIWADNRPLLLTVTFNVFEVESESKCRMDYLCINGVNFCGSWEVNKTFTFRLPAQRSFTMRFVTDASVARRGFEIRLDAKVTDEHTHFPEVSQGYGSAEELLVRTMTGKEFYRDRCLPEGSHPRPGPNKSYTTTTEGPDTTRGALKSEYASYKTTSFSLLTSYQQNGDSVNPLQTEKPIHNTDSNTHRTDNTIYGTNSNPHETVNPIYDTTSDSHKTDKPIYDTTSSPHKTDLFINDTTSDSPKTDKPIYDTTSNPNKGADNINYGITTNNPLETVRLSNSITTSSDETNFPRTGISLETHKTDYITNSPIKSVSGYDDQRFHDTTDYVPNTAENSEVRSSTIYCGDQPNSVIVINGKLRYIVKSGRQGDLTGYTNNERCVVTYGTPSKSKMFTVKFKTFDIEYHKDCCYDFLCLKGVKFCGDWAAGYSFVYVVPANSAFTIAFSTDESKFGRGFEIKITITDPPANEEISEAFSGVGSQEALLLYKPSNISDYADKCQHPVSCARRHTTVLSPTTTQESTTNWQVPPKDSSLLALHLHVILRMMEAAQERLSYARDLLTSLF